MKFVFDFDSTITCSETIPQLAQHFGIDYRKVQQLTTEALQLKGTEYESNLRERLSLLSKIPVCDASNFVSGVAMHEPIVSFIHRHPLHSVVVSANLQCWCEKWIRDNGCVGYFTPASVKDGCVVSVGEITDKARVVQNMRTEGDFVVFVGDSGSDCSAMEAADFSVAFGSNVSELALNSASKAVENAGELVYLLEDMLKNNKVND